MELLVFKDYRKPFQPQRTEFDWLTRDEEEVDKYIKQGFGHDLSSGYWQGFGRLLKEAATNDYSSLKGKPVLVCLGSDDVLATQPVLPAAKHKVVLDLLKELSTSTVKIIMYGGARHEPQVELMRHDLFRDLKTWILEDKSNPQAKL